MLNKFKKMKRLAFFYVNGGNLNPCSTSIYGHSQMVATEKNWSERRNASSQHLSAALDGFMLWN